MNGPAKKVLIVDDEPQIIEILEPYLRDEGFVIIAANDGATGIAKVKSEVPDLVILDFKMPVMNGAEALAQIRNHCAVPVIMLSARSDEVDRVLGLELGADDYVAKPFSPREVVARVKAVLRRAREGPSAPDAAGARPKDVIRVGDIEISLAEHEVRSNGRTVSLTPTEFRILELLASNAGRTFTRSQLLDKIKGDSFDIFDRTLDRHIANLRHKIEPDPANPRYVLTVFGVGYKVVRQP